MTCTAEPTADQMPEDWPEPDQHETFRGAIADAVSDFLGEPCSPESVDPATYGYDQD